MSESITVLDVECYRETKRIWRGNGAGMRVIVDLGEPTVVIATWNRGDESYNDTRTIEVKAASLSAAEARVRELMAAPLPEAKR